MNGRRNLQSSFLAASCKACNWSRSVGASASLIRPAIGKRHFRQHLPVLDDAEPAADLHNLHGRGVHVVVVGADDDEIVRVVGDG